MNEIEEETMKLQTLQDLYEKKDVLDQSSQVDFDDATAENVNSALDLDSRSIYVGNVKITFWIRDKK